MDDGWINLEFMFCIMMRLPKKIMHGLQANKNSVLAMLFSRQIFLSVTYKCIMHSISCAKPFTPDSARRFQKTSNDGSVNRESTDWNNGFITILIVPYTLCGVWVVRDLYLHCNILLKYSTQYYFYTHRHWWIPNQWLRYYALFLFFLT